MLLSTHDPCPCTRSLTFQQPDFMYYLLHITHHAENLQFYLWLRDYTARFAAASADKRALSPAWDAARNDPFAGSGPRVWEKGDAWGSGFKVDLDTKVIEVSPMSEKGFLLHGNPSPTEEAPDNTVWGVRNQKDLRWQPCTHCSDCPYLECTYPLTVQSHRPAFPRRNRRCDSALPYTRQPS